MYDLPGIQVGAIGAFADWTELCALTEPAGHVSRDWVGDVVRDAGLLGNIEEAGFPDEDLYGTSDDLTEQDALATFTNDVWREIEVRAHTVGSAYPYRVDGTTVQRRVASWHDIPSHSMFLLCDIGRRYGLDTDDELQHLFERVVAACAARLVRGSTVRFGWPRDPDWPTSIEDRITRLGEELGLEVESLPGKLDPKDKDVGLDVVARHSFGDNGPGTVTYLVQCATGRNWREKNGEPSLEAWQDLLRWNSRLIRAIAVPWRLEPPYDYVRTFRRFNGAVVLDRLRLLSADVDQTLPADLRDLVLAWCTERLGALPTLR
jgi:hypothetical protein